MNVDESMGVQGVIPLRKLGVGAPDHGWPWKLKGSVCSRDGAVASPALCCSPPISGATASVDGAFGSE